MEQAGSDVSGLFAIIFLAAVVGVFKPYIGSLKRWHFAIAAIVSLILVGSFAAPKASTTMAASDHVASTTEPSPEGEDAGPTAPPSKRPYHQQKAEMDGKDTKTTRPN